MSNRRSIEIEGFGHAGQPIPAASRVGNLLVTGGVYGLDPATGKLAPDVANQARLMFENLRRILEAGGGSFDDVAKLTVFVKSRDARAAINPEWIKAFPDPASRPARHTLQNDYLPDQMYVQCEALAWVKD
jgi:enamine deaminase RidA (YjgF/YER057c/UK114 family)